MKYIRTKDGRIISEDDIPNYYGGLVNVVGLDLDYKESDNIEDLFDEFRLKYDGDIIPKIVNKRDVRLYKGIKTGRTLTNITTPFELYGAIWTDKGLIYVAKLNEKGEWELI